MAEIAGHSRNTNYRRIGLAEVERRSNGSGLARCLSATDKGDIGAALTYAAETLVPEESL